MNRIFIILLFLCSSKSYTQETFVTILDSLSLDQKIIKLKHLDKSNSYFQSFREGKDIILYKNDKICCDLKIFKISSYNDYDIFCILPLNDTNGELNIGFDFSSIIFFDAKSNRCFFIDYGFSRSIQKMEEKEYLINNDFYSRISRIIELDENLVPKSSLVVDYVNKDTLYSFCTYSFAGSSCSKKIVYLDKLEFKTLRYIDFLNLEKLINIETKTLECTQDDNFILYKY